MANFFQTQIDDVVRVLNSQPLRVRDGCRSAKRKRRRLFFESLENRELLAGDLAARFDFTSLSGQTLSSLPSGGDYLMRMFVRDNRAVPAGIRQVYFDVSYPSSLISVIGDVDHGTIFTSAPFGDSLTSGLLNEVGGRDPDIPPSPPGSETLLFSVPFRANAAGALNVTAVTASRLSFFFDTVVGLQPSNIDYSGGTIQIVASGIAVTPTSGLTTTEAGGTASFNVVLQSQPSANVSIALSSSNSSEGTVSVSSLVFTSSNWNIPQSVTVTGVDDAIVDSDRGYSVILASAVSTDARYNGFNPADVSLINQDNDSATLSISAPTITESNGDQVYNFAVSLSTGVAGGLRVAFASSNGTAISGSDFVVTTSSPLIFSGTAGEIKNIAVTINGDQIVEGNETFSIMLGTVTPVAPVSPNSIVSGAFATGTILNDDQARLSITGPTITESDTDQMVNFIITADRAVAGGFSVAFSSSNGTADANDYVVASISPIVFSGIAGESHSISVTIKGDTNVEANETFALTLGPVSPIAPVLASSILSGASATGTIQNDDTALSIVATDAVKAEGNSGLTSYTFTVTRTGLITGSTSVNYVVTGSGIRPAEATDFSNGLPSGTITFAANESSKLITVTVAGDTSPEFDEEFTVSLSNPTGNARIISATATGRIVSDDVSLAIVALDASKLEGASGTTPFTFSVTRTGEPTGSISVSYGVTGTGINPANANDFGGTLPTGTINFGPGETNKTITIPVLGDLIAELNEIFFVTLSGGSGNIQVATATGTILNDDSTTLTIMNVTKAEGTGNGTTPFVFDVVLTNAVSSGFDVAFSVSGGIAQSLTDYVAPTLQSLTFSGTANETHSITVLVNSDSIVEADESFLVTLGAISGVGISQIIIVGSPATGTITNDDSATLTIDDVNQLEGDSGQTPFIFTVRLSNSVDVPVSVNYASADVSARIADNDYLPLSGTLTFQPGAPLFQTISVIVIGDERVEPTETLKVLLSNIVSGSASRLVSLSKVEGIGTIRSDDGVRLSVSDGQVSEGDSGTKDITFNVSISKPVTNSISVDFATADGTATAADNDYVAKQGTLTFIPAGPLTQSISITINGDRRVERDELFQMLLSNLMPTATEVIIDRASVSGTILNDDAAVIDIADVQIVEGDSGTKTLNFNVTLSQPVDAAVSLAFATMDDTAQSANNDYQSLTGNLVFNPGDPLSKSISITIKGDLLVEADEKFNVLLSNLSILPTPRSVTLGKTVAVGTITNDDSALVTIVASRQAVEESNPGEFTIATNRRFQTPVTLNLEITGTATAATDYTAIGSTIIIPANTDSITIPITTLADRLVEGNETIIVRIVGMTSSQATVGSQSTATVTIADNDSARLSIEPTKNIGEQTSNGSVVVTLVTSDGSGGIATLAPGVSLSVDVVDIGGGTATSAVDYAAFITHTLNFSAGASNGATANITVSTINDTLIEGNETLRLRLQNLSTTLNGQIALTNADSFVTIVDNDTGRLSIETTKSVSEQATTQTIVVTLATSDGTGGTATLGAGLNISAIIIDAAIGTATAGTDYTFAAVQSLTFAAGTGNGATASVSFNIVNDALVEGNETFQLRLQDLSSSANGQVTVSAATSVVTIIDNDTARLAIAAAVSASESQGSQAVTVTLTTSDGNGGMAALGPGIVLKADIVDAGNGTAISGLDYNAIGTQTVNFVAGSSNGTTATISVAVVNDKLVEGNEFINLRLQSLSPTLGDQFSFVNTSSVLTIQDNDTARLSIEASKTIFEQSGSQTIAISLITSDGSGGTATLGPGVSLSTQVVDAGGGSAVSGVDYQAIGSQTVLFTANDGNNSTKSVTITPINRTGLTPERSVNLRLQSLSSTVDGQASLGNTVALITINDSPPSSELRGFVYVDSNGNGLRDGNRELGIGGVMVSLNGIDDVGANIQLNVMTADDGSYGFTGLRAGTYNIVETQPAAFIDGKDSTTIVGANMTNDRIGNLRLESDSIVNNNNFGELGLRAQFITIRMTVASMLGSTSQIRTIVAQAEKQAGRTTQASQILARSIPSVLAANITTGISATATTNQVSRSAATKAEGEGGMYSGQAPIFTVPSLLSQSYLAQALPNNPPPNASHFQAAATDRVFASTAAQSFVMSSTPATNKTSLSVLAADITSNSQELKYRSTPTLRAFRFASSSRAKS